MKNLCGLKLSKNLICIFYQCYTFRNSPWKILHELSCINHSNFIHLSDQTMNLLVKGQIFSKNMSVKENRGENKTRIILIAHKYVHYLSFNIYQEITF